MKLDFDLAWLLLNELVALSDKMNHPQVLNEATRINLPLARSYLKTAEDLKRRLPDFLESRDRAVCRTFTLLVGKGYEALMKVLAIIQVDVEDEDVR